MTDHASLLREAATAVRPMIEDDIDKREIYAAWRKKFSDAGLDWMAFKSLQKAHVEDDRDESGDGKRVAKIMDRLDCTAAYAEMLGYGPAKMNENNCFSGSYADAKGRGVDAAFVNSILVGGELTDNQESAGPAPDFTSLAPREADESEQDDVGATASSTNPNSQELLPPADTAGGGYSSPVASTLSDPALPVPHSQAEPATRERGADVAARSPSYSDDEPFQPPAFLDRDYSDPGPIPEWMDRRAKREAEDA